VGIDELYWGLVTLLAVLFIVVMHKLDKIERKLNELLRKCNTG